MASPPTLWVTLAKHLPSSSVKWDANSVCHKVIEGTGDNAFENEQASHSNHSLLLLVIHLHLAEE